MKKAFTLIELLVVIGIIGILAGSLMIGFSGTTESARAAKCLSNMRNLAMAWNCGRAGSQEQLSMGLKENGVKKEYSEAKGWISWATQGLYPSESHQTFEPIGMYETSRDVVEYAFTNGWMHTALRGNRSIYVCPTHKKHMKSGTAHWSYFMNAAFGWNKDSRTYLNGAGYVAKSQLTNAERLLLFAEIPFQGPGDWFPGADSESASGEEVDAILQYASDGEESAGAQAGTGTENIGGNHKSGREWLAHVAFADGHVEKLCVTGLSGDDLKELTTWLCEGKSVGRHGDKFEEIK